MIKVDADRQVEIFGLLPSSADLIELIETITDNDLFHVQEITTNILIPSHMQRQYLRINETSTYTVNPLLFIMAGVYELNLYINAFRRPHFTYNTQAYLRGVYYQPVIFTTRNVYSYYLPGGKMLKKNTPFKGKGLIVIPKPLLELYDVDLFIGTSKICYYFIHWLDDQDEKKQFSQLFPEVLHLQVTHISRKIRTKVRNNMYSIKKPYMLAFRNIDDLSVNLIPHHFFMSKRGLFLPNGEPIEELLFNKSLNKNKLIVDREVMAIARIIN